MTFARYAAFSTAERAVMKREFSTDHIHYDPVSGYIHKFRLDAAERAEERAASFPLFIAGLIAVGLMLTIGLLTL